MMPRLSRRGEAARVVPPRSREGSASASGSASRFQMLLTRGEPMRGLPMRGLPMSLVVAMGAMGAMTLPPRMVVLTPPAERAVLEMRGEASRGEPSRREGSASGSASRFQMLLTRGAETMGELLEKFSLLLSEYSGAAPAGGYVVSARGVIVRGP